MRDRIRQTWADLGRTDQTWALFMVLLVACFACMLVASS